MQQFIIKNVKGEDLYKTAALSFKEAVLEALQSLGNLTGAYLRGADLTEADLTGADLRAADLVGANLTEANLEEADLRAADLVGAILGGANLTGASFTRANIAQATFYKAKLYYGAFEAAKGVGTAYLAGADLAGADLAGADLSLEPVEMPADEAEVNNLTPTKATPLLTPSELESKIVLWAKEKGITKPYNAKNQFLKTVEEVGELASALAKNDLEEVKDSVGDIIVTLVILAEIKGFSATEALSNVYDIISKRTGKTVGGVFVKDE